MFKFLYEHLFKPLAFAQDPERVHDTITFVGNLLGKFGVTRALTHRMFAYENPNLEREVAGIRFKNPIGLAAGFDKNARLIDILPYVGFGFAEFGSITARPCAGNPKPRLWRLPESQALVVNYGLMNDGVDAVLERIRRSRVVAHKHTPSRRNIGTPLWRGDSENSPPSEGSHSDGRSGNAPDKPKAGVGDLALKNFRIGISVAKTNCKETADERVGIEDYFECFQKVNAFGLADYITINVSCPNAYGGEPFTTPVKFERLSAKLKEIHWNIPVFVKLPCDYAFEELESMLAMAVKYGYSGVILSNLTKDRLNNQLVQKSDLSKVREGGISGKPTFERSNALIRHAREYLKHTPSRRNIGTPLWRGDSENSPPSEGSHSDGRSGNAPDKPKAGVGTESDFAVIGCGGVFAGGDAKVKLDAGADLVQMITGMIYEGPQVIGEINKYLASNIW